MDKSTWDYVVRFLDDPHACIAHEIKCVVAPSLAQAVVIAGGLWPAIRASHGPDTGYVVEDKGGRRLLVMPFQA